MQTLSGCSHGLRNEIRSSKESRKGRKSMEYRKKAEESVDGAGTLPRSFLQGTHLLDGADLVLACARRRIHTRKPPSPNTSAQRNTPGCAQQCTARSSLVVREEARRFSSPRRQDSEHAHGKQEHIYCRMCAICRQDPVQRRH